MDIRVMPGIVLPLRGPAGAGGSGSELAERRRCCRRGPEPDESLSRVRLRMGREFTVLDISDGGALIEGEGRLLPGTHVDIHVTTSRGRVLVRSRVSRVRVSEIRADLVRYRAAVAFESAVDTSRDG